MRTPLVFGTVVVLGLLVGCTTVHELGNGRVVVPRTAEVRSPFGTNATWTMLENCQSRPLPPGQGTDYVDCHGLTDWVPMSSQGQGGQIAAGALNAAGLGILGAVMPSNAVSATSVQTQTQSLTTRGHGQ